MKTEYKQDRFLGKTQTHHNDDKDITVINNSRNTTENTVKKSSQNINANKNGINKFYSVFLLPSVFYLAPYPWLKIITKKIKTKPKN